MRGHRVQGVRLRGGSSRTPALRLALTGVLALGVQHAAFANPEDGHDNTLGTLIDGMFEECKADTRGGSCLADRFAGLSTRDVCDLGAQVVAGDPGAIDDMIRRCLPEQMFAGRAVDVGEYVVKSTVLETIGVAMPPGTEGVAFMFLVDHCPQKTADFSGIVYVAADEAAIHVLGGIPTQCVEQ